MITNEDPASEIGAQTVILKNVNLDEVIIAKLDIEGDALDEEVSFTFDDVDIIDSFKKPTLY
ncbi:phage tail tube protein [Paenibacillus larvae]